ncbi:MAG: formate dehydrogenase [Robiginitomaculum sp.]|nr:MAG: formate dehydrogenase [Robiginitomaculum sp.]
MRKIYIPRDTASVSIGADVVARKFADAGFTVVRTGSRGAAWLEVLVEIETPKGRIGYGPVQPRDVENLIQCDISNGEAHPLYLGPVEEIEYFQKQTRITFARAGVIDPLSVEDFLAHGGFQGLKKAAELGPKEIVKTVLDSGLRGRGGAGFPTGIKWQTALDASPKQKCEQKYVVCNADEGDGGTFSDRLLMESDPFALIEGMIICGYAIGATKGYIYLRSEYPLTKDILTTVIANGYRSGWLGKDIGGLGVDFDLELRIGAGAYICGEETSLLDSLEGKRGMVRAKPPLPAIAGLFGKPTIINNVITLASVPDIFVNGAQSYAAHGVARSRGTLPFQLAGNVKRGGLVEVPFGTTLRELIEGFGGGTYSGRPIKAVQVGGPLGSYLPPESLDVVLDYEAFDAIGGAIGHGGIVVFDDSADMGQQARFAFEFCELESCGKCTPCRIGSVRGKETIDKILAGENPHENLALLEDLFETMELGSLCAMGGLTPKPVRSLLKHFPQDFGEAVMCAKQGAEG